MRASRHVAATLRAPAPVGAERNGLPWRAVLRQALPLWAATRVAYALVTWFATLLLVSSHVQGKAAVPARVTPYYLLSRWTLWDGNWYIGIARGAGTARTATFFPLYPLLVRGVAFLLGNPAPGDHGRWLLASLLVSNLMGLAAFVALGLLAAEEWHGEARYVAAAGPVLRVFAAWPLAFFLAAAYTEGTVICLAALTLLFARRGAWWPAAGCAFLAALARPTGLALLPVLGWEYGRRVDWGEWSAWLRRPEAELRWLGRLLRRDGPAALLVLGAVPLAFIVYGAYCRARFGDALAPLHADAGFDHLAMWPWAGAAYAWREFLALPAGGWRQARVLVDVAPVAFVGACAVLGARRRPVAYTLNLVTLLVVVLASPVVGAQFPDALASAGRYMLAAVPIWLELGRWAARRPWLDALLTSGGWMLQALLVAYVVTGAWLV